MVSLEEKISKIFFDKNHNNICLDQPPKAKEIKAKENKWDLIKLTSFYVQQRKSIE